MGTITYIYHNVYTKRAMSKGSKYKGGSKLTPFRLPIIGYNLARARVNDVLNAIANEMKEQDKTTLNAATAQSKTTLANKDYKCGCSYDDGLFRRVAGCIVDRGKHR